MYIILNVSDTLDLLPESLDTRARVLTLTLALSFVQLAISAAFETVDLAHMVTPNRMLVDYVRVYQSKGQENLGCSPSSYPTEDVSCHVGKIQTT